MKLLLATGNANKIREFRRVLEPLGFDIVTEKDLNIRIEVEETGSTFEENALLKAKALYDATTFPTIADDSGLCVDDLDGAPGIYSARYSGLEHNDEANIDHLLSELNKVHSLRREASFICCIVAYFSADDVIISRGECRGTISFERHGSNGFGYDPVFMVNGKSFAELEGEQKDAISHRGRAIETLVKQLKDKRNLYGF